jgi:hypothetical protein
MIDIAVTDEIKNQQSNHFDNQSIRKKQNSRHPWHCPVTGNKTRNEAVFRKFAVPRSSSRYLMRKTIFRGTFKLSQRRDRSFVGKGAKPWLFPSFWSSKKEKKDWNCTEPMRKHWFSFNFWLDPKVDKKSRLRIFFDKTKAHSAKSLNVPQKIDNASEINFYVAELQTFNVSIIVLNRPHWAHPLGSV